MTGRQRWGPPEREKRPEGNEAPSDYTTAKSHATSADRQCGGDTWRRRRTASHRLPSLVCGCRDPWKHKCGDREPSEQEVDAYRRAVEHLLDAGLTPAASLPELRLLWRRGGADRGLAVRTAEPCLSGTVSASTDREPSSSFGFLDQMSLRTFVPSKLRVDLTLRLERRPGNQVFP